MLRTLCLAGAFAPCVLALDSDNLWENDEHLSLLQMRRDASNRTTGKVKVPGHMVKVMAGSDWPQQSTCVADFRWTYVLKDFSSQKEKSPEVEIMWMCKASWFDGLHHTGVRTSGANANRGVPYKDIPTNPCEGIGEMPTIDDLIPKAFSSWSAAQKTAYDAATAPYWTSTPCEVELDVPVGVWAVDGMADYYKKSQSGRHCLNPNDQRPDYLNLATGRGGGGGAGYAMTGACCNMDGTLDVTTEPNGNGVGKPLHYVQRIAGRGGTPCIPHQSPFAAAKNPTMSMSFLEAAAHCKAWGQMLCPATATTEKTKMNCHSTWTSTGCDPNKKCGGNTGVCYGTGDPHYPSLFYDPRDYRASTSFNVPGLFGLFESVDARLSGEFFSCAGHVRDNVKSQTPSYNYAFAFKIETTIITIMRDVLMVNGRPVITPNVIAAEGYDVQHDIGPVTVSVHQHAENAQKMMFFFRIRDNTGCMNVEIHYIQFKGPFVNDPGHIKYYYSMLVEMPLSEVSDGSGICAKPSAEVGQLINQDSLQRGADTWRVDPASSFFTASQLAQIKAECHLEEIDPPAEPEKPPEETCQDNGVDIEMVKEKCEPLQGHDFVQMYEDCIFDGCAEVEVIDDVIKDDLVIEEEVEAAVDCADDDKDCFLVEACETCPLLDLSQGSGNVVTGLRFSKVTSVNGKAVDLEVKALNAYKGKPSKNGAIEGGWAAVNVRKGKTQFSFTFTDSEVGTAVTLPRVCLTFYDLDHGKKPIGQEYIQSCEHTNAATSVSTEIEIQKDGNCDAFLSTTAGTGADNPKPGAVLTQLQKDRSMTMIFNDKNQFTLTIGIEGKTRGGRNFIFAGDATMACEANPLARVGDN